MQEQLNHLYKSFADTAIITGGLASRLSPPLLLSVGSRWEKSLRRTLIIGQETVGWEFGAGSYYPWPHPTLGTYRDFQSYERGVEALVSGYAAFDFAKYQPQTRNSPFWRAFRLLDERSNQDGQGDVLWTNLFRCSVEPTSPAEPYCASVLRGLGPSEVKDVLTFQNTLLRREIAILRPTAIVFFTGPDYDLALKAEFPRVEFTSVAAYTERQFAQVREPDLPASTFRTYHPNYLNRDREKWNWLEEIARRTTSE